MATLLPDGWKRWAMYFTVLIICVHSEAHRLFGFLNHKINQKLSRDSQSGYTAQVKWIKQPIDHFDASDTRTWKMRYFERLDLWKENGPVYLFINGETTASDDFIYNGIMVDLATETDGAMCITEHRYYGKSKPFENVTTENLVYLSSKQALADIANLVKQLKTDFMFKASKVVVIGGSYAGNLAAWFKLLYPDLADAAIASSAPVLAKKDFYEYFEAVGDDYKKYGSQECYSKISDIFHRYEQLLQTSQGQDQLKESLDICYSTDLNKDLNRQLIFLDKTSTFTFHAQYGTPKKIKDICKNITKSLKIFSYTENNGMFWNEALKCNDYEFENIATNNLEFAQWTYQTCTEFGYFTTTTSGRHPFTNNIHVNLFTSFCTAIFGSDFNENRVDEGIKKTNEMYGGLQPNVTHVVFVNGDIDPYHRLGIRKYLSPDAPVIFVNGSSHTSDLLAVSKSDTQALIKAKNYVRKLIKTWIEA